MFPNLNQPAQRPRRSPYNSASRTTAAQIVTMFKHFKFRVFFLLTVGLLAGCGEVEDTRPGQPVKQRQMAFKEIVKSFEPMGVMLRKGTWDAEKFQRMADALATKRDAPWAHFGPDTDYPPSKSTPEVWKQPEQFEKDKKAFLASIDALLTAAQTKDKAQIEKAYDAVHDACKTCHKQFKER
ncbi:MAG: Cytochrome c, class [Proteobacteria bacterium]|nr:Cytochrome c, class [Pseudomonadota bacterium]